MTAQSFDEAGDLAVTPNKRLDAVRHVARGRPRLSQRRELPDEPAGDEPEHRQRRDHACHSKLAQIGQRVIAGKVLPHHLFGRQRHDDLPCIRRGSEARRPIHCRTEVVATALDRLARMDAHPHTDVRVLRPVDDVQTALRLNRRQARIPSASEGHGEPVASGRKDPTPMRGHHSPQQLIVHFHGHTHLIRMSLPQLGRRLDVREQKRDRARRPSRHQPILSHRHCWACPTSVEALVPSGNR